MTTNNNIEYQEMVNECKELMKKYNFKTEIDFLSQEEFDFMNSQFIFNDSDSDSYNNDDISNDIINDYESYYDNEKICLDAEALYKEINDKIMNGEKYDYGITVHKGAFSINENEFRIGNITFK